MIVLRSTDSRWLSHSWLVAAGPGEPAVVVDAGAPPEPLLEAAREARLPIELVVLTHHHVDHVTMRSAFAPAPCIMHALDAEHVPDCARHALHGERLRVGEMDLTFLHIPGHTRGQLGLIVESKGEPTRVFTGDTLFRGSVGGTRGPGHGTFDQLRQSIERVLLSLPDDTLIHAGHGDDSTIGHERATNPFVRAWRGEDRVLDEPCTALGQPATLLTWARDYDGGFKAWLRWQDGSEDTVGGSRVVRASR